MQMVITGSNFKLGAVECSSLQVFTTAAANNSIKISNSSFMGIYNYYYYLALLDFHCFPNHTIEGLLGMDLLLCMHTMSSTHRIHKIVACSLKIPI